MTTNFPKPLDEPKGDDQLLHEALQQILDQAKKLDGQLGGVNLTLRHAPKIGRHAHGYATVKHRVFSTAYATPQHD